MVQTLLTHNIQPCIGNPIGRPPGSDEIRLLLVTTGCVWPESGSPLVGLGARLEEPPDVDTATGASPPLPRVQVDARAFDQEDPPVMVRRTSERRSLLRACRMRFLLPPTRDETPHPPPRVRVWL